LRSKAIGGGGWFLGLDKVNLRWRRSGSDLEEIRSAKILLARAIEEFWRRKVLERVVSSLKPNSWFGRAEANTFYEGEFLVW
jgi:hypothetical protein